MAIESSGKECLIRFYMATAATSTVLFVATLAVMIQLKITLDHLLLTGANVTNELEARVSVLENEISELKQELDFVNQENRNQTNSTTELKDYANKQISIVKTELQLIRTENKERVLCSLGVSYKGSVLDYQISSSNSWNGLEPYKGRLNWYGACWAAARNLPGQWIQVDFLKLTKIRGVMTQGRSNVDQWVSNYIIYCAQNPTSFKFLKDSSGNDKVAM